MSNLMDRTTPISIRFTEKIAASVKPVAALADRLKIWLRESYGLVGVCALVLFLAAGGISFLWSGAAGDSPAKHQDRLSTVAAAPPAAVAADGADVATLRADIARTRKDLTGALTELAEIRAWVAAHDKRWPRRKR